MAEMSVFEKDMLDQRIEHNTRKIARFLLNTENPFKERLMLYLGTPKVCRTSFGVVPSFPLFETEYGKINWKTDFPYLQRDQNVNLVMMVDGLTKGNETHFPAHWTDDMLCLFVKDCVDNAIHEFDYYW